MITLKQYWPILFALMFSAVLIALVILVPSFLYAQGQIVPAECTGPDCNFCHLGQLFQNILNFAVILAVVVSAILFAWAGWKYITNGGNAQKVSEAHSIFVNVAVGLILILAAWLIVDTLMKTLTKGSFGPWNEVCTNSIGGSARANIGGIVTGEAGVRGEAGIDLPGVFGF